MIYELNCPYGLLEARLIRPFQHESHSGTLQLGLQCTLGTEWLFSYKSNQNNDVTKPTCLEQHQGPVTSLERVSLQNNPPPFLSKLITKLLTHHINFTSLELQQTRPCLLVLIKEKPVAGCSLSVEQKKSHW